MPTLDKTTYQVIARQTVDTDGLLTKPQRVPRKFYEKVREMRKDPTIAMARWLSIAPALAARWSVEAKDDAPPGARELIEQQIMPMRAHLLQTCMLGCIDFGWQPYEKMFEIDETGRTILSKLKPLLQDYTEIVVDKETGAYAGLYQEAIGEHEEVDLALEETLVLSFDVEGTNWYGFATMSVVELAYDKWTQTEVGADRYDRKMAGAHWVIHYPLGTSKMNGTDVDNFDVAKRLLNTLESSGGIAVPRTVQEQVDSLNATSEDAWKIELLNDSGGQTAFLDRQKYFDALKVRAFNLPERAVLEGQFGTKAEAQVHADLGITMMEVRHALVVQQINRHVVNQLLKANYGPGTEDKVYVEPAPIADLQREWLKQLYQAMLADPTVMMGELGAVDFEAMRDRLGVPTVPVVTGAPVPGQVTDYPGTWPGSEASPVMGPTGWVEQAQPAYVEDPTLGAPVLAMEFDESEVERDERGRFAGDEIGFVKRGKDVSLKTKWAEIKTAEKRVGKGLVEFVKSRGVSIQPSSSADVMMRGGAAFNKNTGAINVSSEASDWDITHEYGHGVDAALKSDIHIRRRSFDEKGYWSSSDKSFKKALVADLKAAKPRKPGPSWEDKARSWSYAFSSPQEAFAHIFNSLHGDDTRINGFSIKDAMPKTYEIVRKKLESVTGKLLSLGWVTMNGTPVFIGEGGEAQIPPGLARKLRDKDDPVKTYHRLADSGDREATANLVHERGDDPGPGGVGTMREYIRANEALNEGRMPETDLAADWVFSSGATTIEELKQKAQGQSLPGVKIVEAPLGKKISVRGLELGKKVHDVVRQVAASLAQGRGHGLARTTKGFFDPVMRAAGVAQKAIDTFGDWFSRTLDSEEIAASLSLSINGKSYVSTQVNLPKKIANKALDLGKHPGILDSELYYEDAKSDKYGRETEPHVTVKYGLEDTVTADEVQDAVDETDVLSAEITLGEVSVFTGKEYDVVKIGVTSDDLQDLHDALGELPNSDEYDDYKPHVTLAYVRKGLGEEIAKRLNKLWRPGLTFTVTEFDYCDASEVHEKTRITL